MARTTTTSYALLGLLNVRPWTTYELAKQVQRSLRWFWPRAERKLYDEPKLLVVLGLAGAEERFTGKRRSREYSITTEGRAALARWLDEPPAPRATEFEGMLKVFFADLALNFTGDIGRCSHDRRDRAYLQLRAKRRDALLLGRTIGDHDSPRDRADHAQLLG